MLQVPAGEHSFRGRHLENELVLNVVGGEDYYLRLDQIMTYPGAEKLVRERTEDGRAVLGSGKFRPIDTDDILNRNLVVGERR